MQKSRFAEDQIVMALREAQAGAKIADVCRKYGISDATYNNWKAKYSGMGVSDLKRLKALENGTRNGVRSLRNQRRMPS